LSEADVFVKYGLLERAADHLRKLIDLQPDHAEGKERLESVLKQLGRPEPPARVGAGDDPLADVLTPPPREADAPVPVAVLGTGEHTVKVAADVLEAAEAAASNDADTEELLAELEQVDFFVEQSMRDEARQTLTDLAERFPNHPLLLAKMREIDGLPDDDPTGLDARGAVPQEETPPPPRPDSDPTHAVPKAVMASGGEADLATHGDLGIAYKEMGLHDAAIAEFKLLTADPARKVFALTMIGECLEAQGALPDAVVRYKEALNSGPVAEAETAQLYYLLGSAFERLGDNSEALYFFEKVAKRGQFRDVARRIQALKPAPTEAR
jgi:tetratricopeptide (TPR) repeat protein